MRIVFFGQSGPYAPPALRWLLRAGAPGEWSLVVEGLRRRERAYHELQRPGRGPLPTGDSLRSLARAAGIPVLLTSDVNAPRALRTIARFRPDLLVCVGFDRLFSPALLRLAPKGGLNAHPSELPELRGPSPLFWALRFGHAGAAVSVHRLETGEDNGPLYAQQRFAFPQQGTGGEIYKIAGHLAGKLLARVLREAASDALLGIPQDHTRATRAPRPRPSDAQIEPETWGCEALLRFACGAPFFARPWISTPWGDYVVRTGVALQHGRPVPGSWMEWGGELWVGCRDGSVGLALCGESARRG